MGNAFVTCGVIYCIDEYRKNITTINFVYDTKTGKQWNPNIQFINQYGYNSMVGYNPREGVLYDWDNKRQVTYFLSFEAKVPVTSASVNCDRKYYVHYFPTFKGAIKPMTSTIVDWDEKHHVTYSPTFDEQQKNEAKIPMISATVLLACVFVPVLC